MHDADDPPSTHGRRSAGPPRENPRALESADPASSRRDAAIFPAPRDLTVRRRSWRWVAGGLLLGVLSVAYQRSAEAWAGGRTSGGGERRSHSRTDLGIQAKSDATLSKAVRCV